MAQLQSPIPNLGGEKVSTNLWSICQGQTARARRRGVLHGTPSHAWLMAPDTGAQILLTEGMVPSLYYVRITQPGQETASPAWSIDRNGEIRQAPASGEGTWRRRLMPKRDIQALTTALPLPKVNAIYGYKDRPHGQVDHLLSPWSARPHFERDLMYIGSFSRLGASPTGLFPPDGKTSGPGEVLDIAKFWQEVDAGRITLLSPHIGKSRLPVYWDTRAVPARYVFVPGKVAWTGVDGPALYLATLRGEPLQQMTLDEVRALRGFDLRVRFKKA